MFQLAGGSVVTKGREGVTENMTSDLMDLQRNKKLEVSLEGDTKSASQPAPEACALALELSELLGSNA